MTAPYEVALAPLPDPAALRKAWIALQHRSDGSYFVSWHWIGAWLREICDASRARLLSVQRRGVTVALAIVTERRRFGGLGPLHLLVHEVGHPTLDDITIEYNGLLAERGRAQPALEAVVRHLVAHDRRWMTLYLPGIDLEGVDPGRLQIDGLQTRLQVRATHRVDLDVVRARGNYEACLTRRTRQRVRSTCRRLADAHGPLRLERAAPDQRNDWFRALVRLHQAHWRGKTPDGGAFTDARILRFHEALIASARDGEGPCFVRLLAGETVVGYLYQIEWRGIVYYYQAGIDYPAFANCGSPGMAMLAAAVQDACDRGLHRYELMAGDADYKRRLGTAEGRMAWLAIDRVGLASRARDVWATLRNRRKA